MSPWFIFALLLGPFLLFTAWIVAAQLRGRFAKPERTRTEPDFLQRHATLLIFTLVAGLSFLKAGIIGLIAAAIVVLILSLVAALIVTALEGRKLRSNSELATSDENRGDEALEPFLLRFWRNLRSAIPELMSYVS